MKSMALMRTFSSIICLIILLVFVACDVAPDGMVRVKKGEFIMGSKDVDTSGLTKELGFRDKKLYEDERPERKVFLERFYIDKFEVTNKQYKVFIDAMEHRPPPHWKDNSFPEGMGEHPVVNTTWFDAYNYCKWAGKRLPKEEEWEKAARGPLGNSYPWGNSYEEKKANLNTGKTAPAGSYKSDRSYFGVYDMGGNVMEWTDTWYDAYPGNKLQDREFGRINKVLRGGIAGISGHYIMNRIFSRASFRHYVPPGVYGEDAGFRCAK